MVQKILRLLDTYEKGAMSRRELAQGIAILAAAASGTPSAAATSFQGNAINHASLYVSDLQKSTDFYQRVLGCPVTKRDGNNQLTLGKSFLVLRPGTPAGKMDHLAIGMDNFNKEAVTADLKARGVVGLEDPPNGSGFHFIDPDGFPIQLIGNS
jgi:catechol 2,3-dioxygenase-like lactoylglutathione lyase family enzyme